MTRRFRFRWIPFGVTALLVLLGLSLANWQQDRAAQKQALQAKLVAGYHSAALALGPQLLAPADVEPLLYRRITLSGQFVPAWSLYLDNRPNNGHAGFYALTPFRLAGSQTHVLVARGWLPRDPLRRDHVPAYVTPAGTTTIEGLVKLNAGHVMQLGRAPPLVPAAIVQNVDVAELAAASGLRFQPFVLEQTAQQAGQGGLNQQAETLVRDWPAPSLGADRNTGYAFQWYALTLMAILFYVYTGFRRGND
jgi:cytochrome oxidase assembly protein ShyY1